MIEDHANRTRLAKLLRFFSSKHPGNLTSLEDYIGRTKENQDKIYYCAGNGREEVGTSRAGLQLQGQSKKVKNQIFIIFAVLRRSV